MNWQQYKNEIIVSISFIFMLLAYNYKSGQISTQLVKSNEIKHSIIELKKVIALKKLWSDKKTNLKIKKLKHLISNNKVRWSNKRKKLTASYFGLTPNELNRLTTKILNIPVQITKLTINKKDKLYNVELKCKW